MAMIITDNQRPQTYSLRAFLHFLPAEFAPATTLKKYIKYAKIWNVLYHAFTQHIYIYIYIAFPHFSHRYTADQNLHISKCGLSYFLYISLVRDNIHDRSCRSVMCQSTLSSGVIHREQNLIYKEQKRLNIVYTHRPSCEIPLIFIRL